MALALPYCPMIPECSWKKTQIGKKNNRKVKKLSHVNVVKWISFPEVCQI